MRENIFRNTEADLINKSTLVLIKRNLVLNLECVHHAGLSKTLVCFAQIQFAVKSETFHFIYYLECKIEIERMKFRLENN